TNAVGYNCLISSNVIFSWISFVNENKKQTAMEVIPLHFISSTIFFNCSLLIGVLTRPLAYILSSTSYLKSPGIIGFGFSLNKSYKLGRVWRAISYRSLNPLVTIKAVLAPFLSISALVATFVPCAR